MIVDWTCPFWLETPFGTLALNAPDTNGNRWQLVPEKCSASLPVRATQDDIPQGDGAIPHRRWRSGFTVHLALEPLTADDGCPSGSDLLDMVDELGLHINSMIRTGLVPGFPNARLVFTPPGHASRMFDRCQLSPDVVASALGGDMGGVSIEFDFTSSYPYYMEEMETDTGLTSGDTDTITNAGNTQFYPVWRVSGPFTDFTLTNHSLVDLAGDPVELIYNSSLPGAVAVGAGHYIEINTFLAKAFLDGSGASRMAGFDMLLSDFFPLIPGANAIEFNAAGGDGSSTHAVCLSNGAWA